MDDCRLIPNRRSILVASMDLRLGWLLYRRLLYLPDRSHRRDVPHRISCRQSCIFRHLGLPLACP